MPANIDVYNKEIVCNFKGEKYTVRDNGAVYKHTPENKRPRPTDNLWTFGKPNDKGYLTISSVTIHSIVATAFHGESPSKSHVVDHIDTNKQNNRPENLRWLTRLENVLKNPITAKRIATVCGSVEAFLNNPAKFRDKFPEPNWRWMQTVSQEEASNSHKRLLSWAASDKESKGKTLDQWIFKPYEGSLIYQDDKDLVKSETKNAVQRGWNTPSEFPCCPQEISASPIINYANNLSTGKVFARNKYSISTIVKSALSEDEETLFLMCTLSNATASKHWSVAKITFKNNLFIHESIGTYFKKEGAEKYYTLEQGLEWMNGDVFDDFV